MHTVNVSVYMYLSSVITQDAVKAGLWTVDRTMDYGLDLLAQYI